MQAVNFESLSSTPDSTINFDYSGGNGEGYDGKLQFSATMPDSIPYNSSFRIDAVGGFPPYTFNIVSGPGSINAINKPSAPTEFDYFYMIPDLGSTPMQNVQISLTDSVGSTASYNFQVGDPFASIVQPIINYNPTSWLMNLNFEVGQVGTKATGSYALTNSFSKTLFTTDLSRSGAMSMIATVSKDQNGLKESGGSIYYPTVNDGKSFSIKYFVYIPSSYIVKSATGNGFEIMSLYSNDGSITMYVGENGISVANKIGGPDYYKYMKDTYGDWKGISKPFPRDRWVPIEVKLKLSSTKGEMRVYFDNDLVLEDLQSKTITSPGDYFYWGRILTYWEGLAPKDQSLYFDDIIITNQ